MTTSMYKTALPSPAPSPLNHYLRCHRHHHRHHHHHHHQQHHHHHCHHRKCWLCRTAEASPGPRKGLGVEMCTKRGCKEAVSQPSRLRSPRAQAKNLQSEAPETQARGVLKGWLESQCLQLVAAGNSGCAVNGAALKKDTEGNPRLLFSPLRVLGVRHQDSISERLRGCRRLRFSVDLDSLSPLGMLKLQSASGYAREVTQLGLSLHPGDGLGQSLIQHPKPAAIDGVF